MVLIFRVRFWGKEKVKEDFQSWEVIGFDFQNCVSGFSFFFFLVEIFGLEMVFIFYFFITMLMCRNVGTLKKVKY